MNYTEKGIRQHDAIERAGYKLWNLDGIWKSSDDVAVQAIMDNYDPLPEAKADAKERLRAHATSLVLAIYPYPETADIRDIWQHLNDCNATGPRMVQVEGIKDTFLNRRSQINAQTDWQLLDAYNVTVGW